MKRFVTNRAGATSIEYAMIASLIGILLVGALDSIGVSVTGMFQALLPVFN